MIKVLIALIIIAGFAAIGQSRNARVAARLSCLRQILDGLYSMENEIRGVCAPLPVAFEAAGRQSDLFAAAAKYAEEESAEEAFCHALSSLSPEKAEAEILRSFAAGLGAEDETGQLRNISYCTERLKALCSHLEAESVRTGKLYTGSGVLTGILVVILLL